MPQQIRLTGRSAALLLLFLAPSTLSQAADITPTAILKFNTACARCHEGQCSGRLSLSLQPDAASSHIRRYLPALHGEAELGAMYELLRYTKEQCSHYPVAADVPADGRWQAEQLQRWQDNDSGNYFIPLGKLIPGEYRLQLHFATASRAELRVDRWDFVTVLEDVPCKSERLEAALRIEEAGLYYMHLTTTAALQELVLMP